MRLPFVLLSILLFAAALSAQPWSMPLTIAASDSTEHVRFGTASGATDGLDFGLDYPVLSPDPNPPGVWFYLPTGFTHYLTSDFRDSRQTLIIWEMQLINQTGSVQVTWPAESLAAFAWIRIWQNPVSADSVTD